MNIGLFSGIYSEILRAWPNRWLGFVIMMVMSAIVAVVVVALPDQYQSKAKVYINSAVVLEPLIQGIATEDNNESRVRLLRVFQTTLVSRENVELLIKDGTVGFDTSSPSAVSKAFATIKAGVTVTEEEENLFAIDFVDTSPVRARNVAHGLLSLFIERNIVDARNQMQQAGEFLDRQIAEYQVKIKSMEEQIAEFQFRNADALGSATFQTRLVAARTALRDAQIARKVAVETRDRIQAQRASGGRNTILPTDQTLPAAMDRLSALQAQLNALLLQYTDRHPDVVATRRAIEQLSEQYGVTETIASVAKPLTVIPGQVSPAAAVTTAADVGAGDTRLLQATLSVAEADRKIAAATAELEALGQMVGSAPSAETSLEQLQRDYTLLKENLDQLLRRRESARMRKAADLTVGSEQFRIVVAPQVPDSPAGPNRPAFLLLGALGAVAVGASLAYALALGRNAFVTPEEAEAALGLPVIARLKSREGVLSSLSSSAEVMLLLGSIIGLFVAVYLFSITDELLQPARAEIYRLLEWVTAHLL